MAKEHTILFVDDEQPILSALRRVVRREEFDVLTAESGAEALELLREHDVSVIVSDQRMPGMIGAEFLARSKEVAPHAVRLMLTGYSDVETATEAINEGEIHRLITKPWDDEELRATLREAASRYALEEHNRQLTIDLTRKTESLEQLTTLLEERVLERTQQLQDALDENLRLNASLKLRVRELEGRDRIARHLLEFHALEENLVLMAAVVRESLGLEGVSYYLARADGLVGFATDGATWTGRMAADVLEQVQRDREAVEVDASNGRKGLLLPVLRGEQVLGAIAVLGQGDRVSAEHASALESFALQAAVAISDDEAHRSIDDWNDDPEDLDRMLDEAAQA